MTARSTAFSSLEVAGPQGINGALTPARHQQQKQPRAAASSGGWRTAGNDVHGHGHAGEIFGGDGAPSRPRQGSQSMGTISSHAGNGGISLQETEARIDELERSEFDLKLKLFYMEEQMELATGGTDVLQLHKEVVNVKLHRAKAEEKMRASTTALSEMEAKCRELQAQVRDVEAQRTKDRENWVMLEEESAVRLQKHTRLLEDALRMERAENRRLRLEMDKRDNRDCSRQGQGQGQGGRDAPGGFGSQQPRATPRRRSTGEDDGGQPDPWGGSGVSSGDGFWRDHRDQQQQQQLAAKVRSQDSTLRSLRADVTTLRRRLTTQAETLAKQKEENSVVRRAAEQVACVEAEEIARLAVDLERAVRAANAEAGRRRHAEKLLEAAETCLLTWKTGELASGCSPPPRPQAQASRGAGRTEAHVQGEGEGEGGKSVGRPAGGGRQESFEVNAEGESGYFSTPRRALGSAITSRGRPVDDRPAPRRSESSAGASGSSRTYSPRRDRGKEMHGKRLPWGSSPPPSPRRSHGSADARLPSFVAGHKKLPRCHADESESAHVRVHDAERLGSQTGRDSGRHLSVGGTKADSAGKSRGSSLTTSTEWRRRVVPPTAGDATAEPRTERPSWSGHEISMGGVGVAAAIRGVDLKAAIARELSAAVATTPASAASPGNFNGSGQTTPA